MNKLSIIILSHNTSDLLKKCLESVIKEKKLEDEVIAVDNSSTDDSPEMVQKDFPQVKLILSKKNLGYSAGNNLGIKRSTGEYILLLNSDIVVLEGALTKMVQFMEEHPEAAVLGPKLLNADGTSQPSTGQEYDLLNTFLLLCGDRERVAPESITEGYWVSGAALMTRRSIFDRIGFLDENIFMYFEEIEWCLRVKRAGLKIFYYPEAKIIHFGGKHGGSSGTRKESVKNIHKSIIYLYQKHYNKTEQKIVKFLIKVKEKFNKYRK